MEITKNYLRGASLAVFAYMPFHIFVSQWLSTFTGGLDVWKIAKDAVTAGLVLAIVGVVFYRRLYTKTFLILLVLAIIYLALHGLLFFLTDQPTETGLLGTTYNNRLLWFVLIGYGLALLFPDGSLQKRFAKVLIGVGLLVALIGFLQWILPKDIMTHFGYSIERGVKPNFFIDDKPDLPRVFSTLRDPNSLGAFLILPSTILIIRLVQKWQTPQRTMLIGMQALIGLVEILTFSRSGLIGMLLAHAVVISYLFRKSIVVLLRRFAIPLILLLVILFGLGFWLRDNYIVQNVIFHADENTQQTGSTDLHFIQIQKGIDGVEEHPEGQGPGTAGLVSTKLPNGLLTENYFLQVAYEVGVVGLLIFLAFLGYVVRGLWRNRENTIALALLGSFVGLVFMNMLLHTWSNEAVACSWFLLAGLCAGYYKSGT
jgi:O-Antigen ligase